MIRTATDNDKKAIFDLYGRNTTLNFVNQEDYFAKKFKAENILVNEVNGHVAASLQVNTYPLILNGKRLAASYLFGRFYDHSKGAKYMNALTVDAIDQQQYKTLVTLVPTDNPSEFNKYGFENVYQKRYWSIYRDDLDNQSYQGVSKQFKVNDLIYLYNKFVSHFDGYLLRDRAYWLDLIDYLQFKRYNLAMYYNEEHKPEGYMIYYIEASKIVVTELIYLNGLALTRLLCYGLRLKNNIRVFTSQNEDLTRAFPRIKFQTVTRMVAKINDMELFNRLYGSDVKSTMDGFYLSGLPVFISEEAY